MNCTAKKLPRVRSMMAAPNVNLAICACGEWYNHVKSPPSEKNMERQFQKWIGKILDPRTMGERMVLNRLNRLKRGPNYLHFANLFRNSSCERIGRNKKGPIKDVFFLPPGTERQE